MSGLPKIKYCIYPNVKQSFVSNLIRGFFSTFKIHIFFFPVLHDNVVWIQLAQGRDQQQALVNMVVMNFQVP